MFTNAKTSKLRLLAMALVFRPGASQLVGASLSLPFSLPRSLSRSRCKRPTTYTILLGPVERTRTRPGIASVSLRDAS